jgi:hypothetical protein
LDICIKVLFVLIVSQIYLHLVRVRLTLKCLGEV